MATEVVGLGANHLPKYNTQHFSTLEFTCEHGCLQLFDHRRILDPRQRTERFTTKSRVVRVNRFLQKQLKKRLADILHADTEYCFELTE